MFEPSPGACFTLTSNGQETRAKLLYSQASKVSKVMV